MSNYFKKIVLSFLASLILIFSFAPYLVVNAESLTNGQWFDQDYWGWYGKVYDPNTSSEIFGERYTAAQVQWVIYGLISYILNLGGGRDIIACTLSNTKDLTNCLDVVKESLSYTNKDGEQIVHNNNKNLLSLVFDTNRSISGIGYVKEKIDNFRLIPEAKAQTVGFGFDALKPIQNMWRGTRNVAFGLFVLASIIFAFMIMFRVKINPQTVITVQSAIPKVITALILVTFSYAIAGFLIDLMYVVIGILSVVLASFATIQLPGNAQVVGTFNFLVYGQPLGLLNVSPFGFILLVTTPLWIGFILLTIIVLALGIPTLGFSWLMLIPLAIVAITIIWISIKTIWALFKAFANIILSTIFAPLQIALGVLIPNFGFGQWARNYISQLSIFVTTGVLGYLSLIFTAQGLIIGFKNVNGGGSFVEALLEKVLTFIPGIGGVADLVVNSSPWPPLVGSGSGEWVGLMFLGVSFVLFTMIPKATELVASFLAGKPFAYGSAIGEAFGPIKTGVQIGSSYGANYLGELGESQLKSDDPETRALGRRNLQKGSALKTLQGLIR